MAEKEKDMVNAEEELKETISEQEEQAAAEAEAKEAPEDDMGQNQEEPAGAAEAAEEEKKSEDDKAGKEKEKKVFRKKSKEDKKTEALNERISELEDKVKRQLAEFENFRNRTEKEKSAMFEVGAKSVIEKMLPIVDNFERGLSGLSEEEKEAPFASGMQMVYRSEEHTSELQSP